MIKYFEQKKWKSKQVTRSSSEAVAALTPDGFEVEYRVQKNGQYNVTVNSGTYLTNDFTALFKSVSNRGIGSYPEATKPGVFTPFPKWSDPEVSKAK